MNKEKTQYNYGYNFEWMDYDPELSFNDAKLKVGDTEITLEISQRKEVESIMINGEDVDACQWDVLGVRNHDRFESLETIVHNVEWTIL